MRERTVGLLALLAIAAMAVLVGPPRFSNAARPLNGISDPFLAMQMVRGVDDVESILSDAPSPDREAMRLKQYADFGFIACYTGLFLALGALFRRWAWAAAALGLASASFDIAENLQILRIVDLPLASLTQAQIDLLRHTSLAKWTLAALALAGFAALLWQQQRRGLKLVATFSALAALLGLYGLQDHVGLAWASLPMLAGFASLAFLYFRPYSRRRRA